MELLLQGRGVGQGGEARGGGGQVRRHVDAAAAGDLTLPVGRRWADEGSQEEGREGRCERRPMGGSDGMDELELKMIRPHKLDRTVYEIDFTEVRIPRREGYLCCWWCGGTRRSTS
jgi:hypothetical protein